MILSANLGFPRIGARRELKRALEQYWAGEIDKDRLEEVGLSLRRRHWQLQRDCGISVIPSNDFSLYDHMLDMTFMLGVVPSRFQDANPPNTIDAYFAMARGGQFARAMEMTKWFDTNYHYIVPEFSPDQDFRLGGDKPIREFREAKALGITTRPVLIGPVTYLALGKIKGSSMEPIELLPHLLPAYEEMIRVLRDAGAGWIQMDEPVLALDLSERTRAGYLEAYGRLADTTRGSRLMIATYFGGLGENLDLALNLPSAGLHVDLARAPGQLEPVLSGLPSDKVLSIGVIDGRNVWRADLQQALETILKVCSSLGPDRVQVAPSCSLLHCPMDVNMEPHLSPELATWLAFAKQKLHEVARLTDTANGNPPTATIERSRQILAARRSSSLTQDRSVRARLASLTAEMTRRPPYRERLAAQTHAVRLPLYPTTTIGSLPQTKDVRRWRASLRRGEIDKRTYEDLVKGEIHRAIRWQEEIGLDVLVHGEFERNDMVEYFGERLAGFAFTEHGWVQSYGSRCVKPPVLYGDVARATPMTVEWAQYAQSLTRQPVKGMLTGPVTLLQWSFVRDDQPRDVTARQLALAIRDEIADLERAGILIIQIDEPGLREGLPLRRGEWPGHLAWATEVFRLATGGAAARTQIHTHMCYAEFNDIVRSLAELDADVLSIEASRSGMELLDAFVDFKYPYQVGPGVYDIHSPRVPTQAEIEVLLEKASRLLSPEQIWVNPDCGLKTRKWEEVRSALSRMVAAAKTMRETRSAKAG